MATKASVKSHFETGDKPTQAQFEETFDSIPWLVEANAFTSTQSFSAAALFYGTAQFRGGATFLHAANFPATSRSGAAISWNVSAEPTLYLNITASASITATNLPPGWSTVMLKVVKSSASAGNIEYGTAFRWPASGASRHTLTDASGATDIITFLCDGSAMYGSGLVNFR